MCECIGESFKKHFNKKIQLQYNNKNNHMCVKFYIPLKYSDFFVSFVEFTILKRTC